MQYIHTEHCKPIKSCAEIVLYSLFSHCVLVHTVSYVYTYIKCSSVCVCVCISKLPLEIHVSVSLCYLLAKDTSMSPKPSRCFTALSLERESQALPPVASQVNEKVTLLPLILCEATQFVCLLF